MPHALYYWQALDALGTLNGFEPQRLKGAAYAKARAKWFELFSNFGTHFIKELVVGGKVHCTTTPPSCSPTLPLTLSSYPLVMCGR